MSKKFTLRKQERLKSRKLIEQLFKEGRSFAVFPFKVVYVLIEKQGNAPGEANLLFAATAGTKYFKKAVDRNRIKRLTRECYRLNKPPLAEKLTSSNKQLRVFFIYTGKELPAYAFIEEKVIAIINRLIKLIDENSVANT